MISNRRLGEKPTRQSQAADTGEAEVDRIGCAGPIFVGVLNKDLSRVASAPGTPRPELQVKSIDVENPHAPTPILTTIGAGLGAFVRSQGWELSRGDHRQKLPSISGTDSDRCRFWSGPYVALVGWTSRLSWMSGAKISASSSEGFMTWRALISVLAVSALLFSGCAITDAATNILHGPVKGTHDEPAYE